MGNLKISEMGEVTPVTGDEVVIARNGFNYKVNVEDLLGGGSLPLLQHAEVTIAPTQIATLFTLPVELVPAVSQHILYITNIHIRMEAGTALTTTGSGVLRVGHGAANSTTFAQFDQAATTLFFGGSGETWVGDPGKGQFTGIGDFSSNVAGISLKLWLTTADISGGTGNLIANIWYRTWPVSL